MVDIMVCIYNIVVKGTDSQKEKLKENKLMQVIARCLQEFRSEAVLNNCLLCYEKLLEHGAQLKELYSMSVNPYLIELENEDALKDLEALQTHQNEDVYTVVSRIIDEYFSEYTS